METNQLVDNDQRFAFGENWASYLSVIDDSRIYQAETSLQHMLGQKELGGMTFLDIGCGSGLFSLAARNLGAKVISFDYDANSVSCTEQLRKRFHPNDPNWLILQGSVLDSSFIGELPAHDIVYSWGVLHHTGDMWSAIKSACSKVKPKGMLFISIYNRLEDRKYKQICRMKRSYVKASPAKKRLILAYHGLRLTVAEILSSMLQGKHPLETIFSYNGDSRGMSFWNDIVDWIGGYPYEAARPEEVFDFCCSHGFLLKRLSTNIGHGCNQFVFENASTTCS